MEHSGKTALHAAAGFGHVEVVQELLSRGCHVGRMDTYGDTALACAVRKGHVGVVKARAV